MQFKLGETIHRSTPGLVLLILVIPHFGITGEELDHQIPAGTRVSCVLSPGDHEELVGILYLHWSRRGQDQFPRIIAMEPGPLDLGKGLRLLPNEIPPSLTLPNLLLISNLGELELNHAFIAFVRRCLQLKVPVWVVGTFPEALMEVSLEPGQEIRRLPLNELDEALNAWCNE